VSTVDDPYITDDARGENWTLLLGDSCERLTEIEANTVDLSVSSPPFASLFTYSPSPRDLGNSASRAEFFAHFSYIIRENLRVTKPGRIACVHVQQLATMKGLHGVVGLTDFRGEVIRAYTDAGWIFHAEVTIDKDPQAQALRTKAQALMFTTLRRDSSKTRPALADYLLMFRKPGDNEVPIQGDVSNDEWIAWARPAWKSSDCDDELLIATDDSGLILPRSVWYGIRETNTLNVRPAREAADERHIAPLQLDLIERCVRLWTNPGELVFSAFGGIGSEVYSAVKLGRRGVSIELKASYWRTAVANLQALDHDMAVPTLFGGAA